MWFSACGLSHSGYSLPSIAFPTCLNHYRSKTKPALYFLL
jgi:hypothetical protein